jgi:hypothetical protein
MLRRGRKYHWFDLVLEGCIAIIFGMIVWKSLEIIVAYEWIQASLAILAGWGAPKSLHALERKVIGGSRRSDYERTGK